MIYFFGNPETEVIAVKTTENLLPEHLEKLSWLFGNKPLLNPLPPSIQSQIYVGPRASMVTPWSTNAVEITQNMGVSGILRIEIFYAFNASQIAFDPMLAQKYKGLNAHIFDNEIKPQPILEIEDIASYNAQEGLALSTQEVDYLNALSEKLGRKLTDSEVFGFSQINSEHCRHKIFNGTFIIDGHEMPKSLFQLIKDTSKENPNTIVSAYKDNVAFIEGPEAMQFAPEGTNTSSYYKETPFQSILSLKAETHNFPTTVEPFNGAATGSGGEIRDRLAGGTGSIPLAGTAVYMTAYSRTQNNPWEKATPARAWLYQSPLDILIKASNGASDFGNKFGQPLITGSLLTFEHKEHNQTIGYDKVIMLAGGVGYGKAEMAKKQHPKKGDAIVLLGGENYRIGMGGAAVSSADTGAFESGIELNAIQRSNPEMQKRVANVVRALVEQTNNPIVSIHDHGAGGHLNCFSELVEDVGGKINLDALPVGDPTLSHKELIGNESQERMGLIVAQENLDTVSKIAARERAPMYNVGEVTNDHAFVFESASTKEKPMALALEDMFGNSPKTIMEDETVAVSYSKLSLNTNHLEAYVKQVLQIEAVACKDWLTNKVDRCVSGRVAKQQCVGSLQLPLNNCGVVALDYEGNNGIATSVGHAPVSALINPVAGSQNAVAEALTNIVWAPLKDGLKSVSLSANWMWPCNNPGEDARLYSAVKGLSDFALALGINVPTGKDSLSMTQKYPDQEVKAPGTVIVSAAASCNAITKVVEPAINTQAGSLYYINMSQDAFKLGGSSFAQTQAKVGHNTPEIKDPVYFKTVFNTLQTLIKNDLIAAGHDVSAGGLITTLLEMCFPNNNTGATITLDGFDEENTIKILFAENSGVVIQANNDIKVEEALHTNGITAHKLGKPSINAKLDISHKNQSWAFAIAEYRDIWYFPSFQFDKNQTPEKLAEHRFNNYKIQALEYKFPNFFNGKRPEIPNNLQRPKAAILREKGSNSEREMAYALYLAGFDVKDVHMTDLISGRETLEDIQFLAAVGGFSNSDVLGSAKGWAGAIKYNPNAQKAITSFFKRDNTLSLGVCNGCQLFLELDLLENNPKMAPKMHHNDSKKFECQFTSVTIPKNNSVLFQNLEGSTLGIWAAHGEGKFVFPKEESNYNIVAKYAYEGYPANPNGSEYNAAAICDATGKHLAIMPHLERSTFPWNWAYYPTPNTDEVSPWLQAFINAREWLSKHM